MQIKRQREFVADAVSSLENALLSCGPGSDTPDWGQYRQIAAALLNVTNLYVKLERENQ